MNKIEFVIGNVKKRIVVDTIKYIYIQNNYDYWFINKCIRYCSDKIEKDRILLEESGYINILIDENEITKHEEIIRISHHFDLEDDIKCGSKSLMLRYLQTLIERNLQSDEVMQINSFINLVSDLLSDDIIGFNPIELNQRTIPKILSAFVKDEYIVNTLDLSYEEMIELQIKMIISSLNESKRTILFIEIIELNDRIKNLLESIKGVIVIVLFNTLCTEIKNNFVIEGIDLEDEEELYERMINMTNYLVINEYRNYLIKRHSLSFTK